MRSLPNGNLKLRDENFSAGSLLDFFRRSAFKKQFDSFLEVLASRLDRVALADHIESWAQRHESVAFALDNCRESFVHFFPSHSVLRLDCSQPMYGRHQHSGVWLPTEADFPQLDRFHEQEEIHIPVCRSSLAASISCSGRRGLIRPAIQITAGKGYSTSIRKTRRP